jgi:type I restriction enzyme S subunit
MDIQLGEVIENPKYGTSKKCDYETQGIGVLRIPNIVCGMVDTSDLKFAQFDEDELKSLALKQGDKNMHI